VLQCPVYPSNTPNPPNPRAPMSNKSILQGWRQRWNRNLLRFLGSRVRSPVDVEDLAQETYLRLLRAPDLREVSNPEAYLIRVASHVVAEWRHTEPLNAALDATVLDSLVDGRTPDFHLEAEVSQARVEQTLQASSPAVRAALLLRLRDGYAYKDIAQALGITERQVRRYLARGYEQLRQAIER